MSYFTEYDNLKHDDSRVKLFKSTGERDGTRIFSVLNSNIKTLKTVGEYIDTMYPVTTYSEVHKQKIERVRAFNEFNFSNILMAKLEPSTGSVPEPSSSINIKLFSVASFKIFAILVI